VKQDEERLVARLAYEKGLARERERRNILLFGIIGVLGLAGGLWNRARSLRRSSAAIRTERDRSEDLLLNILPRGIAEELKETGQAQARDLDEVSILFTDFKDFTELSEQLSAKDLVAEINTCFTAFDGITARHGIEKIKTIGDAYMAAGGLPTPSADSARNTVLAALDMRDAIRSRAQQRHAEGLPAFEMRIGVHTGPVVAGIVGVKKFAYDVWGDTVNIASRIETSGEAGRVNISASTYALIKDTAGLTFSPRGLVNAKGKGELAMYFVERA
jgi:class 3 adenylate cyclase